MPLAYRYFSYFSPSFEREMVAALLISFENESAMAADPNRVIFTGENHFIRLSEHDTDDYTSVASFWRVIYCPGGPGHVLFLRSELTEGLWRVYSDNIAAARWLQETVQGMLTADLKNTGLAVIDATFVQSGSVGTFWSQRVQTWDEEVSLTWYRMGEPLLIHTQPSPPPGRYYGMCTVLMPALGARLSLNGKEAVGSAWARRREGRPFSTCALAFSESWTQSNSDPAIT